MVSWGSTIGPTEPRQRRNGVSHAVWGALLKLDRGMDHWGLMMVYIVVVSGYCNIIYVL